MFRIGIECVPPFDRPESWTVPYVTLQCKVAEAEANNLNNQYGTPDPDCVRQVQFNENKPPYRTAEIRLPLDQAATMQLLMGGAHQQEIRDAKTTLILTDVSMQNWRITEAAEKKRQQEKEATERRIWLWENTRQILVKHNPHTGVPPLTPQRVKAMLKEHFTIVLEPEYRDQNVCGVSVEGVKGISMYVNVGRPLGPQLPEMLQDQHIAFAKWEYTFTVVEVRDACPRCHQTWTACARKDKWRACNVYKYFGRQNEREGKKKAFARRQTEVTAPRTSRSTLSVQDLTSNSPAYKRAMERTRR